jgi:hypothetical protein
VWPQLSQHALAPLFRSHDEEVFLVPNVGTIIESCEESLLEEVKIEKEREKGVARNIVQDLIMTEQTKKCRFRNVSLTGGTRPSRDGGLMASEQVAVPV